MDDIVSRLRHRIHCIEQYSIGEFESGLVLGLRQAISIIESTTVQEDHAPIVLCDVIPIQSARNRRHDSKIKQRTEIG